MFKKFQQLGKAFMLPIAILPAAGLLLGIGGALVRSMDDNNPNASGYIHTFIVKKEYRRQGIGSKLLELCEQKRLSVTALARISAVPPSTLKNIINGGSKNAGVVTLKKLCDGLEISLYDFFDTETFKTLEQEIK